MTALAQGARRVLVSEGGKTAFGAHHLQPESVRGDLLVLDDVAADAINRSSTTSLIWPLSFHYRHDGILIDSFLERRYQLDAAGFHVRLESPS